jgi:peptidoglycan hydrolase-like protein with peptidoglycan-binding domain
MNSELNFEIVPFEWTAGVRGESEIQVFDELGDLETDEEFERRARSSVRARSSAPASPRFAAPSRTKLAARGPVRAGGSRMRAPMKPPRPKPRPRPLRPGSWGPAAVLVRDPYSSISEPFPVDSTSSAPGTEIVRWAQDCLNHAMGLRLAVNGVMGVDTRSALRRFQGQQGLRVNDILGPDSEAALQKACQSSVAPVSTARKTPRTSLHNELETREQGNDFGEIGNLPQGPFGVLKVASPRNYKFSYSFTPEDALWLARLIVGEAGGYDDLNNHAVIWAMFNRFALFTHVGSMAMRKAGLRGYPTFASFVRSYSTALQPVLLNPGAAQRAIKLSKEKPRKFQYVKTGGFYPGTNIPKGQFKHHLDRIQKTSWKNLRAGTRSVVERALRGQLSNPVGLASQFANTRTYFMQNTGRYPRNHDEWRRATEELARKKKWTWIGPVKNLDQERKNAFFIDNRVINFPHDTVRLVAH